ncbi:nicotinamide phosphoribosyl transferase [Klebsiella phage KpS8]|uniref:Nicotinamide phosphoribosyltransferase n=2 Tax=Mydovirus KpS8 TaxID=2723896 RepID=A0A7L8ZI09_9CAUD|nr:nicotinamide phosphoribosyl transferase [Klebsiella phage KpS8]QIW88267.1 nicotinamide phosphoribosyltransferase [Klebsiella phage KpS8]QOI68668.1 nicotinamide phosphoribosyltransferase [Klebsiella phage vB_KpnM_Seu621]
MLNQESPILFADFYKPSHISMYDKRSEIVQDNMTPRNAKHFIHFADNDQRVMFAGLQGFIKWFLIDMFNNNFFNLPKEEAVADYREVCDSSIGIGMVETWGFEALHDLGYLPLEIRALPEGTLSPVQVPMFTIQNTHPDFYWLPNFLESVISAETWKTITTATTFWQYRKLSEKWAAETCDNNDHVAFQNHCFAYRGEAGTHDAAQSEFGQLINSMGTDTIPAILYARRYYNMKGKFVAGSIPASEHSVATTNIGFIVGRLQGENPDLTLDEARFLAEVEFMKRYITEIFPKGFVSYVADSYDFWAIITKAAAILKQEIMARDGRVVFRPDSGVPEHIIAGYYTDGGDYASFEEAYDANAEAGYELVQVLGKFYRVKQSSGFDVIDETDEVPYHEAVGAVQCLWDIFGGEVNSKGYKVLDSHIGLIYGDSITVARAKDIFERLKDKGFASSNIVYGVGSFTTQYTTRDSLGMAVKATGAVIDGQQIMVVKEPKTDLSKKSAKGFLKVVRNMFGQLELIDNCQLEEVQSKDNKLRRVFYNGKLIVDEDLTTIRERAAAQL